jgi:hypothetical protein
MPNDVGFGQQALTVIIGDKTYIALEAANRAEAAASIAAALSRPLYFSIAAGLAGTQNGDEFAVDNGNGTASIYVNNAGVAVLRRMIIMDPSAPSTASLLGAAGGVTVQDALNKRPVTTVANLPPANASNQGREFYVTDANSTTRLAVVSGGGSNFVKVFCNGSQWLIG